MPSPTAHGASTPLGDELDAILTDPRLRGVQLSVSVRSAETGAAIYGSNSSLHLPAGSNAKLLTSTAALAELGGDFTFRTAVLSATLPANGKVAGDLYLRGMGDPTLLASRFDDLAAAVAARGVIEVRGELVADDTWFDAERLGFDWSQQDEQFAYAAPISALSLAPDPDFNTGSVQVDIAPGPSVGAPATVGLTPATAVVELRNNVVTGPPGSSRQLAATRNQGTEELIVDGSLPLDGRASHPLRTVGDPTAYAADVFRTALARHGVAVQGATRRGTTSPDAIELAAVESMPLRDLLVPWLKLSNNPIAEILVKSMGRHDASEGSWRAGLQVVRRFVAAYGVDLDSLQLVDGSGLSTADLIAPEDLTTVLVAVRAEPWFDAWYAALPIAGEPEHLVGGTLAQRMAGTSAAGNVHAKTGSLTTTSALSGYVRTAANQRLAFSVVENGVIGPPATDLEDAIAVTLADWPERLQ
jgi:D-alanyl-D-alanine carboxypeptidase/D-alanyl-D-alanine-endopeptidase (penicillin-binding protein 4)